jgi:hypothetical protein
MGCIGVLLVRAGARTRRSAGGKTQRSSCDFVFSSPVGDEKRSHASGGQKSNRSLRKLSRASSCSRDGSRRRRHRACSGGGRPRGSLAGRGVRAGRPGPRAAGAWLCGACCGVGAGAAKAGPPSGAVDDLVQLAPVQPDAAAFRAIVDLDPAPVSHHQGFIVDRTAHLHSPSICVRSLHGVANRPRKGRFAPCANCREAHGRRESRGDGVATGVQPRRLWGYPASVLYAGTFRGPLAYVRPLHMRSGNVVEPSRDVPLSQWREEARCPSPIRNTMTGWKACARSWNCMSWTRWC